jgi:hypothetical protein
METSMRTLKIYRAVSGQWAGVILEDGEDVARIAGCCSQDEVVQAAYDCMIEIDAIEYADEPDQ